MPISFSVFSMAGPTPLIFFRLSRLLTLVDAVHLLDERLFLELRDLLDFRNVLEIFSRIRAFVVRIIGRVQSFTQRFRIYWFHASFDRIPPSLPEHRYELWHR